jgi:LysM repeat protein
MNGFMDTLKGKLGPLPTWVWALLFTAGLAVFLIHRKSKAAASDTSTAASGQTNSDLGSASELANMFEVAGLMPYQGGDVYVNTTVSNPPPGGPGTPSKPILNGGSPPVAHQPKPPATNVNKPASIYTVKPGDNLTAIAKKYGISEATLWKFNTDSKVRTASAIATLKKRGQNTIYSGEKIYIPSKSYK